MTRRASRRARCALAIPTLLLAGCGTTTDTATSRPGADGLVDATPRSLAAVVIGHVDPGEPRRTTGRFSDWNDPPALEAQVDYGVDPEGTEDGASHTVHVDVYELASVVDRDRAWLHCRPELEEGRCEEQQIEGSTVLYRWRPGMEEEEGGYYAWTVVRDAEVVRVSYDESGLFARDPRTLDLPVQPEDLRAAALDPAMALRTTPEAAAAGERLDNYDGVEERPEKPTITRTTPRELATEVIDHVGAEPAVVRASRLQDFGPDAVGVHLEFPARRGEAAYTLDVLTTVGRVRQIDPLPCRIQDQRTTRAGCFAWGRDAASTWTLATADEPGRQWIIGAQDDDRFNRVESVGILITSDAIDSNPFEPESNPGGPRLPEMLLGDLSGLTNDLNVGPEQARH